MAFQVQRWTFQVARLIGFALAGLMIVVGVPALASPGCTAVNSGDFDVSAVNGSWGDASGSFYVGDTLSFTFYASGLASNMFYSFYGSLSPGGGGNPTLPGFSIEFTVSSAGTGGIHVDGLAGVGVYIAVVSASCTPAPPLTLTSTASATTQVGQSYSQTNVGSGGATPYTYTLSAGALPAGTTLNSLTGTVSGTPTAAGAFSYTIKATDSTTPTAQTATQVVSGTIAPATLTLTSTASATTQIGQSYSQTNVRSGGATPYTYSVFAGLLPAGTTLNASTGTVSGTPTAAGAFSYAIKVTDSGSPTAQTATQVMSGTIAPATLTLVSAASNTTQLGQFYRQTNVGSGGATPYTYSVSAGALPAGITLNASNGTVFGTPTASGAFSYTVKVTDSGSPTAQTATQTVSGTIAPATLTATQAIASTTFTVNHAATSFTPVTGSGGAAPLAYGVSPSLPTGLSMNSSTGAITGTPTVTSSAATYTVTVTDANSATATATFSLAVSNPSLNVSLAVSSGSPLYGVPVTFTATLSGGSSPTGTVAFKDGSTVLTTVSLSGSTATFTTSSLSVGAHSIVATYNGDAHNTAATSSPTSVNVGARPNPANNPDVTGLVAAEVAAATRYGQTQIDNAFRRLEQIHDEDDEGSSPGRTVPPPGSAAAGGLASVGQPPANGQAAPGAALASASDFGGLAAMGQPLAYAPGLLDTHLDSQSALGQAVATIGSSLPAAFEALNKTADLPFHIWSAGALEFGALKPDGTYDNRFSTSGLTIGLDRDFGAGLRAGVAFGAGFDDTTVGTDGTKSASWAYNASLYASYRFMPHTFVDVIAGYGVMRFDLQRWSTDGAVMLSGTRGGADAFGSVGLTEEVKWGDVKLSPYGRLDVVRASLDAYSETGSSTWALSYGRLDTTTFTGVLGARVAYPIAMSWGTLTPMARLEYSHAFDGGYTQNLGYADLTGGSYSFSGASSVSDVYTAGLSLRAESGNALSLDLEYLLSGSGRQFEGQEIRASVRQAF
jgi:uncharacterized protein with beta-barrel porin domain